MTDIRQRRTTPPPATASPLDLQAKLVQAALQDDYDQYLKTHNVRHVWGAWQLARQAKVAIPD